MAAENDLAIDAEDVRASVHSIWCASLGIEGQSFDSRRGFIESGGFSLAALRLLDALRERFKVDVELGQLLGNVSAEELAVRVGDALRAQQLAQVSNASGDEYSEEGFI